ncbi:MULTISPECIES: helix-turn-helix domain-containing protein [unclassified Pseudomonas]|uniref:helix-turn-helix domain-containing protein n=1 Tax=unclassified Pseudomonas TaxID=196821 RepID=UPI00128B066A|nr:MULTISPECIES: helix-turn-helix domain-containing protein [unclassified Pseudomonas]MPQ67538.1 helix-turn-helix domain-containing protein [Pseudomonas sp. MWU12-2323]
MDAMIMAAARLLASGDVLGALKRVALRDDGPGLALRGIAMAQLGELVRARALLKLAVRAFGSQEAVARARCIVAEAEIALVSRDLAWPVKALADARAVLEGHGDRLNAAHARHLEARRLLLTGHLGQAERLLDALEPRLLAPPLRAAYELACAGIAIRRLHTAAARAALQRAENAAHEAGIGVLTAEVESASQALKIPAARLITGGEARLLLLEEVEQLFASAALVVDACRYAVVEGHTQVSLTTRPVLFALLRALAESWPGAVSRQVLIARAFRGKEADESHRVRLRVEIGRLRGEIHAFAQVRATGEGFVLMPRQAHEVVILAPPVEERHGSLLALLADGEAWSSSALAIALGSSPRTVQRALEALATTGKVQAFGRGPACRWTLPSVPGFPSTLLLPGPLDSD